MCTTYAKSDSARVCGTVFMMMMKCRGPGDWEHAAETKAQVPVLIMMMFY